MPLATAQPLCLVPMLEKPGRVPRNDARSQPGYRRDRASRVTMLCVEKSEASREKFNQVSNKASIST